MRKEPYSVDSIVHVVKRGARGMPIVQNEADKYRFLKLLYFLNDEYRSEYWEQEVEKLGRGLHFMRPPDWPERVPMVDILAYCLMPNHFHLLLREIKEDGISRFMQSLGGSMTTHFNLKYDEKGSIFQGAFKSRTIHTDSMVNYVAVYICVKNPFELYPGGLEKAIKEFDEAFKFAKNYSFCSLADLIGDRKSPIITSDEMISIGKEEAKGFLETRQQIIEEEINDLLIE